MLVWINGPFGGGKTVTAHELARRCPGAVVVDPELVGFGLQRTIPAPLRVDFQELRSWRAGVVEVLDHTLRGHDGPVVVPMTLVEPAYFDEVVGGLRALGHDVRHASLITEPEVVRRRLRRRWRASWALAQVDRCLDALVRPEFAEHVHTASKSVAEVAEEVADRTGLVLAPSADGPVRGWLRRTGTTLRHLRVP